MVRRTFSCLLLLLLTGCAATPGVDRQSGFAPVAEQNVLYIVPFLTIMTPLEIEEGIFDRFVDTLNEQGAGRGYEFVILKEGLDQVDGGWLRQQHYVTGEVFGYIEESGCCSTSIRVKSRIRLFQPGIDTAVLKIEYPREIFFEHDISALDTERRKLAGDIAANLAAGLLQTISSP